MSDFMQVLNQVTTIAGQVGTVAGQVATVVGQVTGRTPAGVPQPPVYQQPVPMAPDRAQWSSAVTPPPAQPMQPAQTAPAAASGGFMQVLSSLFSRIASFFKQLFGGAPAAPTAATVPVAGSPVAAPATDAREQLFAMFPTGQGTALGLVPISVSRAADRLVVSAGSFGNMALLKYQGEYLYYENNKQPVRVTNVASSRTAAGDMHFEIQLENGKCVGADILADGHTIRYKNYTLTLR